MGDSAGAFSAVINNQATPLGARYSVYLLYWCKSTNTDAAVGGDQTTQAPSCVRACTR